LNYLEIRMRVSKWDRFRGAHGGRDGSWMLRPGWVWVFCVFWTHAREVE